jgi:hypothetical protein
MFPISPSEPRAKEYRQHRPLALTCDSGQRLRRLASRVNALLLAILDRVHARLSDGTVIVASLVGTEWRS